MAPRWPEVNNGPEHINEHAAYLREAYINLQAVEKGRANQVPWSIIQAYIECTLAFIGKVLQQPSLGEILQQIQGATKDIQNIQRDVTVIKSFSGLGTTPSTAANFSGAKTGRATWAQVAARPTSTLLPPPPTQQGISMSKTPSTTLTAYKDRSVTVKIKDHGIAQRFRAHPVAWTRRQIQTSIHSYANTKSVKVIAAHQLKSGDIQIFTSTTTDAAQLKKHQEWLSGLGERAEVLIPSYGVIVHGVSTNSINTKDQEATIQQILADNVTVIPHAKIVYVGWLTREATHKRASSIVVEFTDPEMANAVIYAGMAWEGHIHQCQLYDRACRVKQCFCCYHYGHIGTQCNASPTCGYCAELHDTKTCQQKSTEGFLPRCTVCKSAHTAWSNACPARKKELERVEQAKQVRSIYWDVPIKANTARTRTETTPNTDQASNSTAETAAMPSAQRARLPTITATTSVPKQAPGVVRETCDGNSAETADISPATEDRTTPGAENDPTQQEMPPVNPNSSRTEESPAYVQVSEGTVPPPSTQPPSAPDGAGDSQHTNTWLDHVFNNSDDEHLSNTAQIESSPHTSLASEPRSRVRRIYKGCRCPAHQHIYDDWPLRDADLTIAKCMTVCVYCGVDFGRPPTLRQHLKSARHAADNIGVVLETRGRGSSTTPSWKLRPRVRSPQPDQTTRAVATTNRTNAVTSQ